MDCTDSNRALVTAPAELGGPLPRKVKLNSANGKSGLLFVLLIVAWGAAIAVSIGSDAIRQTRLQAILNKNSREVVGQVTGFQTGRFVPIVVTYGFTVDGRRYFGKAEEPRTVGSWSGLRQSDPIPIRFFPPNPAINHPAIWEWSARIWLYAIIFMIFLFAMAGIGLVYLRKERKLAREGKAVAGAVTGCTPDGDRFQVNYEFSTEEGVSLEGKFGSADRYQPGERIWILYLHGNPKRNHPYPLDDYVVVG